MLRRFIGLIFIFTFSISSYAFFDPQEVPVLSVPFSARASALGNSLYCSPEEGIRYNPAFIALTDQNMLNATYGVFQREVKLSSFNLNFHAGDGGIALGASDIRSVFENFTGPDSGNTGTITVSQSFYSIASGIRGADRNVLTGTAVRMLVDNIKDSSLVQYSMVVGAGYLYGKRVRLGIVCNNLIASNTQDEDKDNFSAVFSAWIRPNIKLPLNDNSESTTLFTAVSKKAYLEPTVSFGLETVLYSSLSLRAGFDRNSPSWGLGFSHSVVNIDIAAQLKDTGLHYFATFGLRFGAGENTLSFKSSVRKQSKSQKKKEYAEKKEKIDALLMDGWALTKVNEFEKALEKFDGVLALEPDNSSALYGKDVTLKAKNSVELASLLNKGERSLKMQNYQKAEQYYRQALERWPANEQAMEGIRIIVDITLADIKKNIEMSSGSSIAPVSVAAEGAFSIAKSGSLSILNNVSKILAQKNYRKAYAEWLKIKSQTARFCKAYGIAINVMRAKESAESMEKAAILAGGGTYREAVAELESNISFSGMPADELQKARGSISAYEYLGNKTSKMCIEQARKCISEDSYGIAAVYLERAIKTGYDTETASQLLKQIEPEIKNEGEPNGK